MALDPMAIERAMLIEILRPVGDLSVIGPDDRGQFYISVGRRLTIGWITHGWCCRRWWMPHDRWHDQLTFDDALDFARELVAGDAS